MDKVTIIMPSLNVAKYYRECIESAINQTLRDIEILCIDAGSTDGTEDIIKEYAQKDSRIRFIHSDIKSYGYQVNLGIDNAHGQYIAILETDDIVEPNMYEELYDLAEANHLDVVKADYDEFITLSNGEKMQMTKRLFNEEWNLYNQVVCPREHDRLFCEDYFLWKGIYSREFINENKIRLNETPGAAFQDIGFMQQMLSYADKVMYINESLYRYRVDRDEASTYSPKILQYGWQEFTRLLEMFKDGKGLYLKGLYIHMMRSFRGELYSVLRATGFDCESDYIAPYYDWFVDNIREAIDKKIINIEEDYYAILPDGYDKERTLSDKDVQLKEAKYIASIEQEHKEIFSKIENHCDGKEVVIFGAGLWGQKYLRALDGKVDILAFVDNSLQKQGTVFYGYEIMSLDDSYSRFPDCTYIIANRKYHEEMSAQLQAIGCSAERIIDFN